MDNKELLLNTGLDFFSKSPYEAVGVQDIVNQIHVTKPTLYHYFGSKLGLYEAVFNQFARPFFELIIQKARYERDLINNLNEIALASLEYCRENPRVFKLLEFAAIPSENSEITEFVQTSWNELNGAIEQMFEQAIEQHGNLKGKTALTSKLFIHAIQAQIHAVLSGREPYSKDLSYRVIHQFAYGIFS